MNSPILIPNLAISGFRSFGKSIQYLDRFSKVNLFIGKNNAGKSNILRLIDSIYPQTHVPSGYFVDPLDTHLDGRPSIQIGVGEVLEIDSQGKISVRDDFPILEKIPANERISLGRILGKLFSEKRRLDGSELYWYVFNPPNREEKSESFSRAFEVLDDDELKDIWEALTGYYRGGSRSNNWIPEVIKALQPNFSDINVEMIPAVREIGEKGSTSEKFDGKGIIERLARLQNPGPHDQADRQRFLNIRDFLRTVLDDQTAEIEVPYERDTLVVHMDGKSLPLEALGSGIHEVIILAAAATVLTNSVVCIEEPELHLNAILQKKFMRYLVDNTSNQYFITTHSAALMDTPSIEIYHVTLEQGASKVERVTSDAKRSRVCEDLGYHPSDLLQANCVIWVEGPSDRIYLNYWIGAVDPNLIEGVHYAIMFYGGRLASHLSCVEEEQAVGDFILLRRLNRRGMIIMDSDKPNARATINETKRRLRDEFNQGPGHAWITEGREIENYIPVTQVKAALAFVAPKSTPASTFGKYENVLKVKSKNKNESQASKVEVARNVVNNGSPDFSIFNLDREMRRVVEFIVSSNPRRYK